MESPRFFQIASKTKHKWCVPKILSNYFKNKTQGVPEILLNYVLQKQNTRGPRGSFKLLQKQDKGLKKFFQTTSNPKHKRPPRLFQINSKTRHKGFPRIFQISAKTRKGCLKFKLCIQRKNTKSS